MTSTHSARLERWLGPEEVERISREMAGWYGPPIAVRGVPGRVYAARGGDFVGPVEAGGHASLADYAADRAVALARLAGRSSVRALRRAARLSLVTPGAGFASLGDLIAEATAGKKRKFIYQKVGTTGVVAATNSLWRVGNQPAAGSAAAAAPGGTAHDDTTTGGFPFTNPDSGDTQHLTAWTGVASVAGNTLLLYDRLFAVAKNLGSTTAEAVTGVPTRYTGTNAAGSFIFPETGTVLAATAHTWDAVTYTDQDGNAGSMPSATGLSGCIANRLDLTSNGFFAPLAAGDTGVRAITQTKISATLASGAVDWVLGHPLAWLPQLAANYPYVLPLINDAFSLERVYDDACFAFLEVAKSATGATTYTGQIETVSG